MAFPFPAQFAASVPKFAGVQLGARLRFSDRHHKEFRNLIPKFKTM
jgi:hypothetical protein